MWTTRASGVRERAESYGWRVDVYELVGRTEPAGAVLYEVSCTECGARTPAVTSPDGCVDLDEQLVCGHDPVRRDLVFVRESPVYFR